MPSLNGIADRLKQARNMLKMTQADFATPLATSWESIKDIETGRKKLSSELAVLMEKVHNVDLRWLLTGEGEMFVDKTQKQKQITATVGDNNLGVQIGTNNSNISLPPKEPLATRDGTSSQVEQSAILNFNVKTMIEHDHILGFQMFHAKLEIITLIVTIGNLEMFIYINHTDDSTNRITLKTADGGGVMVITLVNVGAKGNMIATFDPVLFAENKEDNTSCFLQITMTRPNDNYDYWLYLITFCEKEAEDGQIPAE